MGEHYLEGETLENQNYSDSAWKQGEYEECRFVNCHMNSVDLSASSFIDCTFEGCDLSMVNLNGTALKDVRFEQCKLLGLKFENCNPFLLEMEFTACQLTYSSFHGLKLKGIRFVNCQIEEADFSGSDLTQATFDQCNLAKTLFDNTLLERADLRTAYHYSIHPEHNYLNGAKFAQDGLHGLLDHLNISIE